MKKTKRVLHYETPCRSLNFKKSIADTHAADWLDISSDQQSF